MTNSKNSPDFPCKKEILCKLKAQPAKPLFPPASDRKAWLSLPAELRKNLIAGAEKNLKQPWAQTTAKEYMKYKRNGDRNAYETPFFRKRGKLMALVCGECCEYSGRFMDEIIEGLWQILSEPVWCLPAHERIPNGDVFPDPSRFQIDLFSAATGRILCDTLSLLEPELTKMSPYLVQRIKMELMRRVIEPAEKLNDENTAWFSGRNNWTPWCASNIIGCGIYLLDDQPERLAKLIDTYLGISIRFYNRYPDDGGCDEGPSYWFHAAGKYIQVLHQLDHRLNMKGKLFEDKKLQNMCNYLPDMNLSGNWVLSSADATSKLTGNPNFLAFVAKHANSPKMMSLAKRLGNTPIDAAKSMELDTTLIKIFNPVPENVPQVKASAVNYWKNLGICIMRQTPEAPEKGSVVTLKGGHNNESHNHLDLGHFTLLRRNRPLIVDIGSGVYTATTFSERRYTLWNINTGGHNIPRFDDLGQKPGAEYTAPVTMQGDSVAVADLAKAYPENVGIKSFIRRLTFNRQNGNVSICDTVQIDGNRKIKITLYSAVEPERISADTLNWNKLGCLKLKNLKISKVSLEKRIDADMKASWGKLWKIDLTSTIQDSGSWSMDFEFDKK